MPDQPDSPRPSKTNLSLQPLRVELIMERPELPDPHVPPQGARAQGLMGGELETRFWVEFWDGEQVVRLQVDARHAVQVTRVERPPGGPEERKLIAAMEQAWKAYVESDEGKLTLEREWLTRT